MKKLDHLLTLNLCLTGALALCIISTIGLSLITIVKFILLIL